MNDLMNKCNTDVFVAILVITESQPEIGEKLIALLREHQFWWQMDIGDVLWFSAHLPLEIWDRKVHTFQFLFQSQQTTPML